MTLAIDPPPTQQSLIRDLKIESPLSYSTTFLELDRDEIYAGSSDWDFDKIRFALVRCSSVESRGTAEWQQIEGSQQVFFLPMRWRNLPVRHDDEDRYLRSREENDCVRFGELSVDFTAHEAKKTDFPIRLTTMDFKTLKYFVRNPHRVISRDELLDKVWGYDNYPCTRTVDNRILRLRQKLEIDATNPKHFLTVFGSGYKFAP